VADPLIDRALFAIEDNATAREQARLVREWCATHRDVLRLSIFESASLRSEMKARRDDRQ